MALPAPRSGILGIAPYVAGKSQAKPHAGLGRVVKLSSNESPLGPSAAAVQAYLSGQGSLARYPDSGHQALKAAIAQAHGLDASRIVCGAGSDEIIGLLTHAYAGPGDEALYSAHGFLMYRIYAQGFGTTPVTAPEKEYTTSVDALLAAVTPRTKIVFVANPNNPTGTYISGDELARLRNGLPEHVLLAVDAAYAEYAYDAPGYADGRALVESTENTVMLRTFSKIYALPALRLGYGYLPRAVADVLERIRGPFNVSAPAIAAGIAAAGDAEHIRKSVAHNQQWLGWLAAECGKLEYTSLPSVGNFLLVRFKDAAQASAMNAHLMERGLIVREVVNYGLPEFLRITVGTEEENRALIDAMRGVK